MKKTLKNHHAIIFFEQRFASRMSCRKCQDPKRSAFCAVNRGHSGLATWNLQRWLDSFEGFGWVVVFQQHKVMKAHGDTTFTFLAFFSVAGFANVSHFGGGTFVYRLRSLCFVVDSCDTSRCVSCDMFALWKWRSRGKHPTRLVTAKRCPERGCWCS